MSWEMRWSWALSNLKTKNGKNTQKTSKENRKLRMYIKAPWPKTSKSCQSNASKSRKTCTKPSAKRSSLTLKPDSTTCVSSGSRLRWLPSISRSHRISRISLWRRVKWIRPWHCTIRIIRMSFSKETNNITKLSWNKSLKNRIVSCRLQLAQIINMLIIQFK